MTDATLYANRRDLLAGSLLGAVPGLLIGGLAGTASASPLDPGETIIRRPDQLSWTTPRGFPERSVETCDLAGSQNGAGLYYGLVRWWPGYMSAPHTYATDRLCMVLSGTWWCNSGSDFEPTACVAVTAGSYVRRVAGTPHYDGVVRDGTEPAVIAICGMAPVAFRLVDPAQPGWRRV